MKTKYKHAGKLLRIPLLSVLVMLFYSLALAQNAKLPDVLEALKDGNLDEAKILIDGAAGN